MRISSDMLCRANGKLYEQLTITDLPAGTTPAVVWPGDGPEAPLPCSLYEVDAATGAVRPCVPGAAAESVAAAASATPRQNAVAAPPKANSTSRTVIAVSPLVPHDTAAYTIGTINEAGQLVETARYTVDFKKAVWRSRKNYRLHADACAAIRCCDERAQAWGACSLVLDAVIPTATHMLFRMTFKAPDAGTPRLCVLCVNERLERIASEYIPMGEVVVPAAAPGMQGMRRTSFTVRIPWNQPDVFVYVWDENLPAHACTERIAKTHYDELLTRSHALLNLDASADPYYAEWLAGHRRTPFELSEQRRAHFAYEPRFSIIVPLFKTPAAFFTAMVDSVRAQTYPLWELVLVNASPESTELARLVSEACAADDRIVHVDLDENRGISLNTNAGIAVATGDFISFFDHDDVLEPDILFEYARAINEHPTCDLLYCDEDKLLPDGTYTEPFFKPTFSLDLLRCNNYVCHMLTIRTSLLATLEPNTPQFDGAQDHNLTLEAIEHTRYVHHVPRILYHWRVSPSSTAGGGDTKPYATQAGIRAVQAHLDRLGIDATVTAATRPFTYEVAYTVPEPHPLVSIIIPTSDHVELLRACVTSIMEKTTYNAFEIVVVENNSRKDETFAYYDELERSWPERVRVVRWEDTEGRGFNFSALINFGAAEARGDLLLLLNNDTELITDTWLERMVGNCLRPEVGVVGVRLLYPDGTVQHAGVNLTGGSGHLFRDLPAEGRGYFWLAASQRNLSAVTGACMMVRRDVFQKLGGFDESFAVAFNDVDFCLKAREQGLLVVYLPSVELVHRESISRGFDEDPTGRARYIEEESHIHAKWSRIFAEGDPYYTPNLRPSIPEAWHYHF